MNTLIIGTGTMKISGKCFRQIQQQVAEPFLTVLTITLAVLLFVVGPLQAAGIVAAHQFGIALGLVMVAAVFIVSGSAVAIGAILTAIALIIVATVTRFRQPSVIDIYLDAIAWLLMSATLSVVVARAVFAAGRVSYHRVIGAVMLSLNIGVTFMALYCFVSLLFPNAFNGIGPLHDNLAVAGNLIYFSFTTLTTVGYGDIVPLHPFARGLTNVEAIIGQLYPATLLARFVTLYLADRHRS